MIWAAVASPLFIDGELLGDRFADTS